MQILINCKVWIVETIIHLNDRLQQVRGSARDDLAGGGLHSQGNIILM